MKPLFKLNPKEEVYKMCKEKINALLATVTLLLISVSVCVLIPLDQSPKENPYLLTVLASAYGTILVLLIQMVILLRKPKNNNNVIVVAIDGGNLPSINYVPTAIVINMCRKMFEMEYEAVYCPIYRCWLLARHKNLVAEGDKLFGKDESRDRKYVAFLKYKEYDGKEAHIIRRLSNMPSEIEAAKFLIRITSNDGYVFYSARELSEWYQSLPVQKQTEWAKPVLRFLKDGTPHYF